MQHSNMQINATFKYANKTLYTPIMSLSHTLTKLKQNIKENYFLKYYNDKTIVYFRPKNQ